MNRVLVPYDFSPHSRRACALAMQGFPFGMDVEIELLHVVDQALYANVLASKHVPSDDAIDSYLGDELIRIEAEIAVAHGQHSEPPRLLTPKRTIARGRPYQIIDERLREPEMVGALLGGQGHGGATERLLGRTAQRVLRHAKVPVLVVKHPHSLALPARLMAAVDWSDNSKRALLVAARLCNEVEGLLSVLHVIESPYVPYVKAFAHERDAREALQPLHDDKLARLATFVGEALAELDKVPESLTEAVVFGDPPGAIAAQAAALLADLIVVGAHGTADLSRFLLGSTAERLVTAAHGDILVVP
ncbi:MAG TPA: universal stress protein [Enhygromyxa sp.]|nr:universal stress protein [Enhygromyxa sp.]